MTSTPSTISRTTLAKGDTVQHPQHGLGRVRSIRLRSFGGDESATYAELYFQREALTINLRRRDLAGTVRSPISSREASSLLDKLETSSGHLSPQWKARANSNQAILDRGDPFECAVVYKGLRKLEAEGKLRTADRAHLGRVRVLLADELAFALDKSAAKVEVLLDKCCAPRDATH
ncbi:MAG: hypothetical protein ABI661_05725 [Gammaproteobacteria bacterium]